MKGSSDARRITSGARSGSMVDNPEQDYRDKLVPPAHRPGTKVEEQVWTTPSPTRGGWLARPFTRFPSLDGVVLAVVAESSEHPMGTCTVSWDGYKYRGPSSGVLRAARRTPVPQDDRSNLLLFSQRTRETRTPGGNSLRSRKFRGALGIFRLRTTARGARRRAPLKMTALEATLPEAGVLRREAMRAARRPPLPG